MGVSGGQLRQNPLVQAGLVFNGSMSVFQTEGTGASSVIRSKQYGLIAQQGEHRTCNAKVEGASPSKSTNTVYSFSGRTYACLAYSRGSIPL